MGRPTRKGPDAPLTKKEALFVDEFVKDGDGAKAIKRAGYSPKYADRAAHVVLQRPWVQKAVAIRFAEVKSIAVAEATDILEGYTAIVNAELTDYMRWGPDGIEIIPSDQLSQRARRAVNSMTMTETITYNPTTDESTTKRQFKFSLEPKKVGLDGLARYYDLWREAEKAKDMGDALHRLAAAFEQAYAGAQRLPAAEKTQHVVYTPGSNGASHS